MISTGGAVGGRALRASRCCHVKRQCARSARESGAGVAAGGETGKASTVTRWRHEPPYPGSARLSAGPIPPQDGMRSRQTGRQRVFWRGLWQGMQDSADPTRFFSRGAMSLTVEAHGTGATVCDAGGIKNAHRPIMLGASFLRIQGGPVPTPQRVIWLKKKIVASQASYSRWACPLRRTEGRSS